MDKSKAILLTLCAFFMGIVIGFLLSPIKKGMEFGNNAGNTTNYYGDNKAEKETKEEQ